MPQALSKLRVFGSVGYAPHPGQRPFHLSRARHRVATAGRRFGKSIMSGHELTPEALLTYTMMEQLKEKNLRREFWIVGPEYSDSEKEFRVVWNDLKNLDVPFDKPGSYNAPWNGEMSISLWDGLFQVHAKSAKYPGTLVGEGLSGVILAEAAKLKVSVWHKFIRPTLADFRGWSIFSTTPEGKNWLYELWQRGQDPNYPAWESWRLPSWHNPIVFPGGRDDEEIKDMEAEMSPERFAQEVGADFTEFVGRVFKGFDEEIHVGDFPYDPRYPLYLGVDYGWSNPFVLLLIQVDSFDNVYVIGEFRTNHTDTGDIGRQLLDWRGGLAKKARIMYPDPAGPNDTAQLSKILGVRADTDTGGELKWRLELTRSLLKLGPEHAPFELQKPRLFIDRSCNGNPMGDGGMIREMQDYRYPDTKSEMLKEAPENPLSKDDHAPEAFGRFARGYFGGPEEPEGQSVVRVSTARMG